MTAQKVERYSFQCNGFSVAQYTAPACFAGGRRPGSRCHSARLDSVRRLLERGRPERSALLTHHIAMHPRSLVQITFPVGNLATGQSDAELWLGTRSSYRVYVRFMSSCLRCCSVALPTKSYIYSLFRTVIHVQYMLVCTGASKSERAQWISISVGSL